MQKLIVLLALLFFPASAYAQGFGSPNGVGFPSNGSGSGGGGLTSPVGISDGGTGQTAKTAAFDALSPNTTGGDVTYHNGTNNVRLGVGLIEQTLASGGTAPLWSNGRAQFPPSIYTPGTEFYKESSYDVLSQANSFTAIGTITPTVTGTATSVSDATGDYVNMATTAVLNNVAGTSQTGSGWCKFQNNPRCWFVVKTGANSTDLQNCRIWIGLFDSNPHTSGNPGGSSLLGVRFDTSFGDTTFKLVTQTLGTQTVVDTGVVPALDTKYVFCFDTRTNGVVSVYINGTAKTSSSTNLPGATATLFPRVGITTLSTTIINIRQSTFRGSRL